MNIKDFAQIIIETYKGTIGKGPSSIKVTELDNVLLIDIKGALTPLEYSLLQIAPENKEIIREIRSKILGHVLQKDIEQILKIHISMIWRLKIIYLDWTMTMIGC